MRLPCETCRGEHEKKTLSIVDSIFSLQPRRVSENDFLSFDSEDEEDLEAGTVALRPNSTSDTEEVVFENNLLDGLSDWLERLFEGTTHRYNIQYWPDNMK